MAINNETFIGKIKSVSGSKISVLLDVRNQSMMPVVDGIVYRVGQIGSFVKIPLGYTKIYGIVTQVGTDAIPESLKEDYEKHDFDTRWFTVVLVGQSIGNKFERGVLQFPTADDEVHMVTIEDLTMIYDSEGLESSITVGHISTSESLPAKLDINKLVTRHCVVLGATGSGKSNTVSIILDAIAAEEKYKSARILLIDPHGEYNETLKEHSKVFKINADTKKGENELIIPYWALPYEELIKIFPSQLNETQESYVRENIVECKKTSNKILLRPVKEETITSDSPIPFSIKKLWFDLDDFERQTFRESRKPETKMPLVKNGNAEQLISNQYPAAAAGGGAPFLNHQAQGILRFLNGIRSRLIDQRFKFLFECEKWTPSLEHKVGNDLDELLKYWIGHEKAITILDLSGIPSEIMISISGALLKIIYDALFWGQNLAVGGRQQPLLLVLEEAHNYLKAGENSISSRTVQNISKEGRKYGIGLLLATQRPSELDETVLSQCGTVIALRMSNKSDQSKVSSAIQQDLNDIVSLLPSLRTGEGIVTGEAVKIPSRIKFNKISYAPKSSDPDVCKQWASDKPNSDEYTEVVELWRSGRLK